MVKAINELLTNKEPFLSTLQKNIATVLNEENDNTTDDIDRRLEELQQQLLIQAKSKMTMKMWLMKFIDFGS